MGGAGGRGEVGVVGRLPGKPGICPFMNPGLRDRGSNWGIDRLGLSLEGTDNFRGVPLVPVGPGNGGR